jgi:hypothetical protein
MDRHGFCAYWATSFKFSLKGRKIKQFQKMVYCRTACTMRVRNATEERTAVSLHDSQRARARSTGGEKSFVPGDGWVSPTPQSNPNSPTSNGCSAPPCTYRVQIYLPRMIVRSSEQLQFWPLHSTPLALGLTCKILFCLSVSPFRYSLIIN